MNRFISSAIIAVLLLTPLGLIAGDPGFYAELEYPSAYIAPYPAIEQKPVIRLFSGDNYYTLPLSRTIQHNSKLERSSFFENSLTFSAFYYYKGKYIYRYTDRTADADAFSEYRRRALLNKELGQIRATALTKRQQDKAGGLLSLNIPIKSKTFEGIFGEGGAGLKVSGYHRITFSGRSQWTDQASTATNKQSKFPSLNMEQISRFEINGTIGSKITVSVSQDSKTDIPLANRLILRYKGDEDDILQTVEAGNTNLSLPNTRFVGYSQSIRGLFGVKTTAQIGGLNLTAIASQEKGNSERTSIEAGASATMTHIRDYQYAYGRIYDLGRVDPEFYDPADLDFHLGDSITYIEVYKSSQTHQGADPTAPPARFFIDPLPLSDTLKYEDEKSGTTVLLVDPAQYLIHPTEFWILFEMANAGTSYEIGYYMEVKRADGTIDTIGNLSGDPYILKMLRPNTPTVNSTTWNYEWRNIYSLQGTNIDVGGLEINIFRGKVGTEQSGDNEDHQNGTQYIQIMGLDRYDQSGNIGPDGLVDVDSPIIDPYRGLLIFPDRRPFDPFRNFVDTVSLSPTVPEIYDLENNQQEVIQKSEYYLQVSNLSRQAEVSLGKPNIIENSERISINGRDLVKGKDYNINYDFGRVTFLTDEALDPNANIAIDFEYTPFITAQKKSLFGIRGEYEFSDNLRVGTTFLYKSDKATERKPKVGQETSRAMVWDGDISFKLSPEFLTGLVNTIPFYSTEAKSNLQVSAEIAKSFPNPNVDGVAYIDDFEGSRDSYSLGIFRESWTQSSKPETLDGDYYRSRMIWYNPYTQIATDEIWDRELRAGETGTHTLWIEFSPHDSLIAVTDPDSGDTTSWITPKSWTGVMRSMSAGAVNQSRAQLLEFRVYGYSGIMHVDLGDISEDVNGNGQLDTEDKKNSVSGIANGIIDPGEDRGLDGLFDEEEPGYNEATNPDPHGDDWWYNGYGIPCEDCKADPYDYRHINGTEGNALDPNRFGRPDTEDIDRDLNLDVLNNYFTYEINLAEDRFLVENSEFNDWRTFRVPIRDPDAGEIIGDPYWSKIDYIRIWFESPDEEPFIIGIAAADLIQSNWDDSLVILPDNQAASIQSKFNVAVINNQENADYKADPPPGVTGYYDKANEVVEPEQSLLLHYEDLNPGDTCIARRILYDTPSYMGYRKLNMLVHGAPDVDSILFFFRIGDTEDKYYEFQTMLKPGWNPDNEVNIDFNEITALKEYLIQARKDNPDTNEIIDGNYRIWGDPTITRVKYLTCGLVNMSQDIFYSHPTGDVWVNELKLTDVRRDPGTAARVAVSGNMADLFTYRGNYEYEDSYFRKLSSSTRGGSGDNLGSGKTSTTYSGGISFQLDKFLPRALAAKIPVSINYSKKTIVPLLRTNTDIFLPEELRNEESTVSESKSLTISESFSKNTRNPIFTLLLNPFKANFSYNRSEGRSPQRPYSFSETYHVRGSYGFRIKKVPGIRPFFWTSPIPMLKRLSGSHFYFFPGSLTANGDLDRNLSISENSSGVVSQTLKRSFSGNARLDYRVSDNLSTNFNMSTTRDLNDPETVKLTLNPKTFRLGRELSYGQSFGATYGLSLFRFLTHNFNYSVDYRESINVRDSTRHATSTKSYGVSGTFDHKQLFTLKKKSDDNKSRRRRQPRTTDTTNVEPVDTKPKTSLKERVFGPISSLMMFLTGWLNPVSYDFNEKYSYALNGLQERASMEFRFGFTDDVGVPIRTTTVGSTRSTAITKSTSYSLRTGTQFLGGLKTDVTYSKRINRDIVKVTNPSKSISTTFPDLKFTIKPLKTITIFNSLINRFNPRTGYTRQTDKTYNLQTGSQASERVTIGQRPLVAMTANVLNGVQLSFSTDKSVSEDKVFNSQNGEISSKRRQTQTNTTFSIKYSFSSPRGIKIPIFGRLRFRSTLSFSTDVSIRKQKTESAIKDGGYSSTGEQSNLAITPTISYSFSSQINGGLSGKWQTSNDIAQNRKSNVRELRIWVDIKF